MRAIQHKHIEVGRADLQRACIPQLVAARATESPGSLALRCGNDSLTYSAMNARANRVANHLHALGVGAEVPVGLCLPRSLDMAVAALGILKAGAAYVPMDPG